MGKTVSFSEKDTNLVNKIEKFQKEKNLRSFTAAVRMLCSDALQLKKISK